MRLLQLTTTLLTLGAGSLAILIPPSDSLNNNVYKVKPLPAKTQNHKVDTHGLTPEQYAITQIKQTLEIPCESCPFPKKGQKDAFDNTPNNLHLTLSLDVVQRDIIKLNDVPMFPVIYAARNKMPFQVIQKSLKDGREAKVPIDIDLFIETDPAGLSRLRLHVLAVSGFKTIATMEILEFPVFQNEQGEVFIGEAVVRPPTTAEASAVMCKDNAFCRWKAYIYDTLNSIAQRIKGAPRRKCGKGKQVERPAHAVATEQPPHGHHKSHGTHKTHKQHQKVEETDGKDRPQWRWFNWVGLVIRLILACLVIAAITITIGLFFTLIVSTAVHVAVVSWLFIKGYACRRKQTVDDEEEGLMTKEEEAQLNVEEYKDDLPIYSENQQKKASTA
ncbi:hypothetical protein TWF703_003437 [Orbilia oligospora]|uniref:Uncharacterized protein n=2 Tax=Orbilia oligospora TaxID=2813651 RepID=A0A7C8JSA4_ORBOL|nr:hypothetical protein TWF703_003437 [Orbilia oligospora]